VGGPLARLATEVRADWEPYADSQRWESRVRLAASRRGPGSLRPHAAKESGYASQLPP